MEYKCPRCKTNYILDGKKYCKQCRKLINGVLRKKQKPEADFYNIVRGCVYGTNSRKIYEKFCQTLGWDTKQANQFGWQTPLYAEKADRDRVNDIWFIFYPNYDSENLSNIVDNYHAVNLIKNNGKTIIEIVDDRISHLNNTANRITFVKTSRGYEFLGVYKIVEDGQIRIYQLLSDHYPF